jgi:uncharacterized tellurite resistance protein B-like protein
MHGPDAEIAPAELQLVLELLNRRSKENLDVSRVLDDVMLTYVGQTSTEMLAAAVASLSESMSDEQRLTVLQDLADIASADGMVYPNEVQFIVQIARQWGLEQFLTN